MKYLWDNTNWLVRIFFPNKVVVASNKTERKRTREDKVELVLDERKRWKIHILTHAFSEQTYIIWLICNDDEEGTLTVKKTRWYDVMLC